MTTPTEDASAHPSIVSANEIHTLHFEPQQAALLQQMSRELSAHGGPQVEGAGCMASLAVHKLKPAFSKAPHALLNSYVHGQVSALKFTGLLHISNVPAPQTLPALSELEKRTDILTLGSRNQILLSMVDHTSFAYDIDNDAKLIRLVANFNGGGREKIMAEPERADLSSHSGLALGPHTEAPYWCAVTAENGHSPSPSALILSALWNPADEPTSIIPLAPILEQIGITDSLALTTRQFNFTRSDSFVKGKGEEGRGVSIVDFKDKIGLAVRFNAYRFSVDANASHHVKRAYQHFNEAIAQSTPVQTVLTQENAIIINNHRALHCRDIVHDNRRLLVRLFGLASYAEPVVIAKDPLLLRG
jgi:hypothetical protein